MRARLILFEGPPGAGKSTLSQFLAAELTRSGRPARWLEEHTLNEGPFAPFFEALDAGAPNPVASLLDCWQRLLAELADDESAFAVLDGAFFFNTLKFLLAEGRPQAEIRATAATVAGMLAPFDPLLLFLAADAGQSVRGAIATRGQPWAEMIAADVEDYPYQQARGRTGVEGMCLFFEDAQCCLRELLAASPLRQMALDTTAGRWTDYEAALRDAFELAPPLPAINGSAPDDLTPYLGSYQPPAFFPEPYRNPFTVTADGRGLTLNMYFVRGLPLVAHSPTHFAIRGRPLTLEFVLDDGGEVTGAVYPFVPDQRFICPKIQPT